MSLFGKKESTPAPRPSFPLRPMPGPEQKPQPKPVPELKKLFGKEGYQNPWQLREFARKAPYEPLPGTGRKLGKQQRVDIIKELEERAKKAGQTLSLSERTYRERILPQMRKEIAQLQNKGQINKATELRRKAQQIESWIKGA